MSSGVTGSEEMEMMRSLAPREESLATGGIG